MILVRRASCIAWLMFAVTSCGQIAAPATDGGPRPDATTSDCTPEPIQFASIFVMPQGAEQRMVDFIDDATTSLDVQMYLFTVDEIKDAIVRAHARGVDVRVLLDYSHDGNISTRNALTAAGVPLRDAPTIFEFSHAKYMVADGQRALIMSGNFNVGAFTSERNYGVVVTNPEALTHVAAIFAADWAGTGGVTLPCTSLVASPNNAKPAILELIGGATNTLDLSVFYVSETNVIDAIIAAKARGVQVRILLADTSTNVESASDLRGEGLTVRFAKNVDLHAKLIVADGRALVGSHNLSNTSLTRNRELGVVVPAEQSNAIRQQFETDWNNGSP